MRRGVPILWLLWVGCGPAPAQGTEQESRLPPPERASAERPFEPLPTEMFLDPARVELGRRLFEDPRVSGDGERACVDCHSLSEGGVVPGEARSNHPLNETGPYNVPTVFNVAFNFRYNWQGRFETLEEHLGGPMMSESVMNAGSWEALVERLRVAYDVDFQRAGYVGGVTEESIRDAMSTYQRSLVTPNAPFDRFLRGEAELAPEARGGLELFVSLGCASCHQGINVGGNLYQRFGVMEDAFGGRALHDNDYGRMQITGREEDAYVFRVPSLRNVALTAPYFHDGSAATLPDAVRHMSRVQLGTILTDEEVGQIVAFLHTLTGERDGRSLAAPAGREDGT
ncbi:MAG: cytochrome-c peroxidase [Sandaracinaceae bacterium]